MQYPSGQQFSTPQQQQEAQCSCWYPFLKYILINPTWRIFFAFSKIHEKILFLWTFFLRNSQHEILQLTFLFLERSLSKTLVDGFHCELPLGHFYRHTACRQIGIKFGTKTDLDTMFFCNPIFDCQPFLQAVNFNAQW